MINQKNYYTSVILASSFTESAVPAVAFALLDSWTNTRDTAWSDWATWEEQLRLFHHSRGGCEPNIVGASRSRETRHRTLGLLTVTSREAWCP